MAKPLILLVPGTRIELVQGLAPRDFKSNKRYFLKSTISTIYLILLRLLNNLGW